MTKKIGLFYGSSTCYTEIAAEKICDRIGESLVDLYNIADSGAGAGAIKCLGGNELEGKQSGAATRINS